MVRSLFASVYVHVLIYTPAKHYHPIWTSALLETPFSRANIRAITMAIKKCVHVIHPVLSFSNLCNLLKNAYINRTRSTLHKFQSGTCMVHGEMKAKTVAEHFGVAASTISRLKGRFNETGRVQGRPRSERPKKTSAADDRYLVVTSHRNSFMSVTDLTEHVCVLRQRK